MKIVNFKRFSMFVIGVILMIIVFISILDTNSLSNTKINYIDFTVGSNDNLWKISNIVKENNINYSNKDVREIIYEIKEINNLSNSNLIENQVLKIPEI